MTVVAIVVWVTLVALSLAPVVYSIRQGRAEWPWIVAVIALGPLAGIAFLASRHSLAVVARRDAEYEREKSLRPYGAPPPPRRRR